jgi:predicted GNAT family acetyltransferase
MWSKARQSDLPELIELLCLREWENLHFSSRIHNKGRPKLPGFRSSVFIHRDNKNRLKSALLIKDNCQLFPLFPHGDLSRPSMEELGRIIQREAPEIFSLIGEETSVKILIPYLPKAPKHIKNFLLMVQMASPEPMGKGLLKIKKAKPGDLEILFPLEEGYQREEVLRDPHSLNTKFAKSVFLRQLKEQLVMMGKYQGKWVAKAGTNAQGFHFSQLGGIYTHRDYRGQGLALELVQRLGLELLNSGRRPSLFVNIENTSAQRLYQKAQYQDRGGFIIAYYS